MHRASCAESISSQPIGSALADNKYYSKEIVRMSNLQFDIIAKEISSQQGSAMYKPNERIDWIVLPIPSDFSKNSKLRNSISTSRNVLNLMSRYKLKTVQDLLDFPYEEIDTMKADPTQKGLVHAIKQELEEYFAPYLVEKDHDDWLKPPQPPSNPLRIPEEKVLQINAILKSQYDDDLFAYQRESIWRNRYRNVIAPVFHVKPTDKYSLYLLAVNRLRIGLKNAIITPIDSKIEYRRWFFDALDTVSNNPFYHCDYADEKIKSLNEDLLNHCVEITQLFIKWSEEMGRQTLKSPIKTIVDALFADRQGPFGITISPKNDILSTLREALFSNETRPVCFDFFGDMLVSSNPKDFLPEPKKPKYLKSVTPQAEAVAIINQAVEIKAKRDAIANIKATKAHEAYTQLTLSLKDVPIENIIRGRTSETLFALFKTCLTTDGTAHWIISGNEKSAVVDKNRQYETVELTKRIVKLINRLEEGFFPIQPGGDYSKPRRYFTSDNDLFKNDIASALCEEDFNSFIAEFRDAAIKHEALIAEHEKEVEEARARRESESNATLKTPTETARQAITSHSSEPLKVIFTAFEPAELSQFRSLTENNDSSSAQESAHSCSKGVCEFSGNDVHENIFIVPGKSVKINTKEYRFTGGMAWDIINRFFRSIKDGTSNEPGNFPVPFKTSEKVHLTKDAKALFKDYIEQQPKSTKDRNKQYEPFARFRIELLN